MGGFVGGMDHLYDNDEITFAQIKGIFTKASTGELEGTEKTDGQNAVITFDVEAQEAKIIRNKKHEKVGGVNRQQLIKFFTADRIDREVNPAPDSVVRGYDEALASFEEVAKQFPLELQKRVFLSAEGYPIFYNAEVMATANPNVISYDSDVLLIHRVGHYKLNLNTGGAEALAEEEAVYLTQLESALEQHQEGVKQQKFRVQSNAIKRLAALDDDTVLNTAVQDLEKEQNRLGISDSQTVAEYLIASLDATLDRRYGENVLADEQKIPIIKALMEYREKNRHLKSTIKNILATVPEIDQAKREIILDIMSNDVSKSLLNEAILPLEFVIHFFSIEMLRAFESFAILDNTAESKRLEKDLNDSIALLTDPNIDVEGKYPKVYALVQRQIAKFQKKGDKYLHKTAAEGFVFDYDGKTYKFTGSFAPLNQIMGIFEYGRGDVPPMKSLKLNEEIAPAHKADIALYPGKFKPPHAGHYDVVLKMASPNAKKVLIVISDREHEGITSEQSLKVWEVYLKGNPNITPVIASLPHKSPVGFVYNFIDHQMSPGQSLVLLRGIKDKEDGRYDGAADRRSDVNVVAVDVPPQAGGVSASMLRDYLINNNKVEFFKHLPLEDLSDKEEVWNILRPLAETKKKSINADDIYGLVEKAIEEFENLKETNSMGSGNVSGGSAAAFGVPQKAEIVDPYKGHRLKKKKNKKDSKEDKMVNEIVDYLMKEV